MDRSKSCLFDEVLVVDDWNYAIVDEFINVQNRVIGL